MPSQSPQLQLCSAARSRIAPPLICTSPFFKKEKGFSFAISKDDGLTSLTISHFFLGKVPYWGYSGIKSDAKVKEGINRTFSSICPQITGNSRASMSPSESFFTSALVQPLRPKAIANSCACPVPISNLSSPMACSFACNSLPRQHVAVLGWKPAHGFFTLNLRLCQSIDLQYSVKNFPV